MARVSVDTLGELLERGAPLLLVDVRSAISREDGRIPGAVALPPDSDAPALAQYPREATIVVYCACPNDASAVVAARRLLERGWRDVRPLAGGYDAWVASGRGVERG